MKNLILLKLLIAGMAMVFFIEVKAQTKLVDAFCVGTPVVALDQTIEATDVPGATNYEIKIIGPGFDNSLTPFDAGDRFFTLRDICAGIRYGTTYEVSVRTIVGGITSAFGAPCTLTTIPHPATRLVDAFCVGNPVVAIDQQIQAIDVPCADKYEFKIIATDGSFNNSSAPLTVGQRVFTLRDICAGIRYGTTYEVSVRTIVGGITSAFGAPCTLTTIPHPATRLVDAFCMGNPVVALDQTIETIDVPCASQYDFLIDDNSGFSQTATSFDRFITLNKFAGPILCGTIYSVRVKTTVGGIVSNFGIACQITTQPCPYTLSTTVNNTNCNGQCNGSIDLTVSGGAGPFIFLWSNGAITQDISGLCVGTYSVTVKDVNNVASQISATVTQLSANDLDCDGICNDVDVSAISPFSDMSSVASNEFSDKPTPLSGTTSGVIFERGGRTWQVCDKLPNPDKGISFVVSNGSQDAIVKSIECIPIATFTIPAGSPASFTYTCSSASVDVENGTVLASVTEGDIIVTASISSGNSLTFSPDGTGGIIVTSDTGSFTPTIVNVNGVDFTINPGTTDTITICTISSPVVAINGVSQIIKGCEPLSTTLNTMTSGGKLPYSFLWSTGQSGSAISVTADSTTPYSVTVTDNNGCTATNEHTISVIEGRCGKSNNKILVCHKPPGNPSNAQELCISTNALNAHLSHGDVCGPCMISARVAKQTHEEEAIVKRDVASKDINFALYPNPNDGTMQVNYHLEQEQKGEFVIYDVTGRKIRNYQLNNQVNTLRIADTDMEHGVYMYSFFINNEITVSDKLIIFTNIPK